MPFKLQHFDSNLRIGLWRIEESETELKALWQSELDVKEATESRRTEWLASRLCLKELLGVEVDLYKDEFGKPHLRHHQGHISLSHCKGYAAAAFHAHHPIGIDMESINERILSITTRFIRDDERMILKEFGELRGAYFIWSAKESLFKLYGRKSLNFKKHLKIHPANGNWYASLNKEDEMFSFELNYQWIDNTILTWMHDKT